MLRITPRYEALGDFEKLDTTSILYFRVHTISTDSTIDDDRRSKCVNGLESDVEVRSDDAMRV